MTDAKKGCRQIQYTIDGYIHLLSCAHENYPIAYIYNSALIRSNIDSKKQLRHSY
jgi:hypothetical protein